MANRWYDSKGLWNRSPILRAIDQRLAIRILVAFLLAFLFLIAISLMNALLDDKCQNLDAFSQCLTERPKKLITIENAGSFALLTGAVLFVMEGPKRNRTEQYEAWQVIDNAAAAKVATSYARTTALKNLNQSRVPLKGIDVPKADLQNIDLQEADLRDADLRGVDFRGANLRRATLIGANLTKSNLSNTQLNEANLSQTILKGSDLREANLSKASLCGADLSGADLTGAILDWVDLRNVKISQATKLDSKWLLIWQIQNEKKRARNLANKDLSKAFLKEADLTGANLRGANLRDTNLEGSNLLRARLAGADTTNTILPWNTLEEVRLQTLRNKGFIFGNRLQDKQNIQISRYKRKRINHFHRI